MKKILLAPLNWGLGHASRCIPIIEHLQRSGVEVWIGSDGDSLELLRAEFPDLPFVQFPSYNIRYRSRKMVLGLLVQAPNMLWAIWAEHRFLRRLQQKERFDAVISDNRYGCWLKAAPSVIISHQLRVQSENKLAASFANRMLSVFLRRFDHIWVPDIATRPNLSGALSGWKAKPGQKSYIGILSRMQVSESPSPEYDVAVVLSGPEPQRSILEEQILAQALHLGQRMIIVQGKTHAKKHYYATEQIELVSYLTSEELNRVMLSSNIIVCRSGYSSVMDLAALGKKAVLIPTPGQTEQEYILKNLRKQGWLYGVEQDTLELEEALRMASECPGIPPEHFDPGQMELFIDNWLKTS